MARVKKMKWEDVSSYSRSDKERIPNEWRAMPGGVPVLVHRTITKPGAWVLTCRLLGIQDFDLSEQAIEDAKESARLVVLEAIEGRIYLLQKMVKELRGSK